MSIERNKKDFENALDSMGRIIEDVKEVLKEELICIFDNVITEYGHFQSDIHELIERVNELGDAVDQLSNELLDSQKENNG